MTQASNKIEQAISGAEDLYVNYLECDTENWSVIVAGEYQRLVEAAAEYCEEIGITMTVDEAQLATPTGLQSAARVQLVNNPMKRLSRTKIQFVLERLGFYMIAVADTPALIVIGPEKTAMYSKHEMEVED